MEGGVLFTFFGIRLVLGSWEEVRLVRFDRSRGLGWEIFVKDFLCLYVVFRVGV